jgi:uncharacterized protein (DUF2062 family)
MKQSIDDLTNEAVDIVLQNDALHNKVLEPLKKKLFVPVVACGVVNALIIVLLIYIANRLRLLPLQSSALQ